MSKRWGVAAVMLFGAVSLSPAARADAVAGPPTNCPPGAVGDTSHNGSWCRPTTCNVDEDCAKQGSSLGYDRDATFNCREQPLCVETRSEKSRSGWSSGTPITRQFGLGECGGTLTCTAPATCETTKRCVKKTPLLGGPGKSGGKCQCGAAGLSTSTDLLSAAPLLALLVLARRRARRDGRR